MTVLEQTFLNVLGRLHTCRFKMNSWNWRDESSWETFLNMSLENFSPEENELFFQWMDWLLPYNMSRHLWRKRCFLFYSFIAQKWLLQKHVNYGQNYSHEKRRATKLLVIYYRSFHKICHFLGKCLTSLFWNFRALLRM